MRCGGRAGALFGSCCSTTAKRRALRLSIGWRWLPAPSQGSPRQCLLQPAFPARGALRAVPVVVRALFFWKFSVSCARRCPGRTRPFVAPLETPLCRRCFPQRCRTCWAPWSCRRATCELQRMQLSAASRLQHALQKHGSWAVCKPGPRQQEHANLEEPAQEGGARRAHAVQCGRAADSWPGLEAIGGSENPIPWQSFGIQCPAQPLPASSRVPGPQPAPAAPPTRGRCCFRAAALYR